MVIVRKLFGVLAILMGVTLVGWIGYNLFHPTPEYRAAADHRAPFGPLILGGLMIGCGIKWLRT